MFALEVTLEGTSMTVEDLTHCFMCSTCTLQSESTQQTQVHKHKYTHMHNNLMILDTIWAWLSVNKSRDAREILFKTRMKRVPVREKVILKKSPPWTPVEQNIQLLDTQLATIVLDVHSTRQLFGRQLKCILSLSLSLAALVVGSNFALGCAWDVQ